MSILIYINIKYFKFNLTFTYLDGNLLALTVFINFNEKEKNRRVESKKTHVLGNQERF